MKTSPAEADNSGFAAIDTLGVGRACASGLGGGSRLHTLDVGSSINRSLTEPVARAGRGIEVIIDIDEAPDAAAQRLVAATQLPVLVDVEVVGGGGLAPS